MPVILALWEAEVGESLELAILGNTKRACFYKNKIYPHMVWCMTVVPATWEAKVGGWLGPGRLKLQ